MAKMPKMTAPKKRMAAGMPSEANVPASLAGIPAMKKGGKVKKKETKKKK